MIILSIVDIITISTAPSYIFSRFFIVFDCIANNYFIQI